MSNKLQFVEMLINGGLQQTIVCWTLLNLTPLSQDPEQLEFAIRQERVLFSYNVGDFSALHIEYLREGKEHAGMVLAKQKQFGIGEQMRRLLHLTSVLTAEEMQNQLEFLSSWQEVV